MVGGAGFVLAGERHARGMGVELLGPGFVGRRCSFDGAGTRSARFFGAFGQEVLRRRAFLGLLPLRSPGGGGVVVHESGPGPPSCTVVQCSDSVVAVHQALVVGHAAAEFEVRRQVGFGRFRHVVRVLGDEVQGARPGGGFGSGSIG